MKRDAEIASKSPTEYMTWHSQNSQVLQMQRVRPIAVLDF
jgi:hypothetical protein